MLVPAQAHVPAAIRVGACCLLGPRVPCIGLPAYPPVLEACWQHLGCWPVPRGLRASGAAALFFIYFLKIKISKIYVRFEIFQKYSPVAPIGRLALSVIFFFKFAMRSLAKKKGPVAHPTSDRGLSPTRSLPPIYKPWPSFPCHLSLKIQ